MNETLLNKARLNVVSLNKVLINGAVERHGSSGGGGGEVIPPEEPDVPDVPVTYTLSASASNGVVSASVNGKAVTLPYTANEEDVVVVEVTANDGYEFEGWSDGSTDNPRSITMNADVALSAQCVEVVAPPVGNYIQFEDKAVEAICVANWSSDGIGLTMEDAAKVEEIPNSVFRGNKEIVYFNELQYFTRLKYLGSYWSDDKGTFADCTSLKSVVIPMQVTDIRHQAFRGCTSLESVNISHLTNIGDYSFRETAFKGEVYCPYLQFIGYSAFARCKNLTKVVDLGKVTDLRGSIWSTDKDLGTFARCDSLESAIINDCVESIGYNIFYGSTALQSIIARATTPPSLANGDAFTNTNNCPIYVPDAALEVYKTATNWSQYQDRIHPLSEIEGVVIEMGYELQQDGTIQESADYFVVGFVPVNGGESILWASDAAIGVMCEYDAEGNRLDYWRGNGGLGRTVTLKPSTKKIKACFKISAKDSSYILDKTNGNYLWKGANVE